MKLAICEAELKVLYEISLISGQLLDLRLALKRILGVLSQSLSMERATVTLLDLETGHLKIQASHGLAEAEVRRGSYRPNEGITGRIFSTAEPFVVPDISEEPLFLNRTQARRIRKERISFLGVPIKLHRECIGVLSVDRLFGAEVSFEEDIRFLTIVAALIAQFIHVNRQVRDRERSLRMRNEALRAEVSEKYNNFFMIGKSASMTALRRIVEKVAPSKASILLLGESGTGKTLVARIIHELSPRARAPFVKLNCAALPENLLESELFGHEKGAFTGATAAKPGRFEEADGGTIFLDEIGELPLGLQAKLLRFLQEREFERLGSTRTLKVDVRMVAATNRDLSKAVQEGLFREDLYYRLNVFPILVPPLRDRVEDVLLLAEYFLERAAREYGRALSFDDDSKRTLREYSWPGNVRELENLAERLAILVESSLVRSEDLSRLLAPDAKRQEPSLPTGLRMRDIEQSEILAALERNQWVRSWAARELGFTLRQFCYRLRKYGLEEHVADQRRRLSLES